MAFRVHVLGIALMLAGCSEGPLRVQPLPTLVTEAPRRAQPIGAAPMWVGGEQLTWDVSWRGVSVGRAQLATGEARAQAPSRLGRTVRSRFRTLGMAARLSAIRHDLATREADVRPRRDRVHTIHSAVATVRAWAAIDRGEGFLILRFDRVTYRLDVARPMSDASHLRVDCRLTPKADDARPIAISMWLTDDELRVPTRVEIEDERGRVTAELIDRTL